LDCAQPSSSSFTRKDVVIEKMPCQGFPVLPEPQGKESKTELHPQLGIARIRRSRILIFTLPLASHLFFFYKFVNLENAMSNCLDQKPQRILK
jgi:hypothetical protein